MVTDRTEIQVMATDQTAEQFLKQLPSVSALREKLRQHRDEGKLLRRLLKLASEREASTATSAEKRAESC